ncbi:DUF881 domain-containing protein [Salipaludibacillus sp. LMS25]|uniref:DUF881 domain-containing protein n=1 Tax=Salipaludibacillus sp. LMS25 TaxID=2924031 RepID=UPI0020CFF75D|nr:DUF881 domain-containing protein [Salipaludibacillus sp. LMS25]UTR15183.1 DUF881 domain-containing protein [Salipaludibacillus sp. LMS25]
MKAKKSRYVFFSFVLLITGFLIALSFQLDADFGTNSFVEPDSQWQTEHDLRNDVLLEQETNRDLAEQLKGIQSEIKQIEDTVSDQEQMYFNLVEDMDKLRMVTGEIGVKGEGVLVTLTDAQYIPGEDNPNSYIVHEQHIQQVVDELLVSGAEALAINGHRITHKTYIQCIGPVIEIDGEIAFAPFEVTAIGDRDTLEEALNLTGGVKDQLVSENIQVRIEKKNNIQIDPYFSESGEGT